MLECYNDGAHKLQPAFWNSGKPDETTVPNASRTSKSTGDSKKALRLKFVKEMVGIKEDADP